MQMHVILKGVVGSTAYGLASPDSDIDRAGIFALPTQALLGLGKPRESVVTKNPDSTMHEALKACRLMLGGNPTASEVLWLEKYDEVTELGLGLIRIRTAFLSARRVKEAYLGYATQQFRRLIARASGPAGSDVPHPRAAKHARHMMRLVEQGYQLYTSGHMDIRVEDPQACLDFGERVAHDPRAAGPYMAVAEERFATARTVLPDHPDTDVIEAWLRQLRDHFYDREGGA